MNNANENLWFWIRSLNETIFDFADIPENTLNRISKKISIPEDLMNDLDHWFKVIQENEISIHGDLLDLIREIFAISKKYDGHANDFWTNEGFYNHPDWTVIRNKCRNYIRKVSLN